MSYTDNLLTGTWTVNGATAVTGGYSLSANASIATTISELQFILSEDQHYKLLLDFIPGSSVGLLDRSASAYAVVIIQYLDGDRTRQVYPINADFSTDLNSTVLLKTNRTLTNISVEINTSKYPENLVVKNIALRRYITPLEDHNSNPNPHNLPLNIFVNQEGIKALKGEEVVFWLKDNGDAVFSGELKAATGTFQGVYTGNITIGQVQNLPSQLSTMLGQIDTAQGTANNAHQVLANWAYDNNTTFIDGGKIFTGTISAQHIYGGYFQAFNEMIIGDQGNKTQDRYLYFNKGAGFNSECYIASDAIGTSGTSDLVLKAGFNIRMNAVENIHLSAMTVTFGAMVVDFSNTSVVGLTGVPAVFG